MRRYENQEDKKLIEITCNKCGRKLRVENGYLKEGCFTVDAVFGYFSRKDGMRHRFDLCEDCYDDMTAQFAVPVEEAAETELM